MNCQKSSLFDELSPSKTPMTATLDPMYESTRYSQNQISMNTNQMINKITSADSSRVLN
jgi:hypothetical protein